MTRLWSPTVPRGGCVCHWTWVKKLFHNLSFYTNLDGLLAAALLLTLAGCCSAAAQTILSSPYVVVVKYRGASDARCKIFHDLHLKSQYGFLEANSNYWTEIPNLRPIPFGDANQISGSRPWISWITVLSDSCLVNTKLQWETFWCFREQSRLRHFGNAHLGNENLSISWQERTRMVSLRRFGTNFFLTRQRKEPLRGAEGKILRKHSEVLLEELPAKEVRAAVPPRHVDELVLGSWREQTSVVW